MNENEKVIWCDTRQKPKQWNWLKECFIRMGYKIKDDKPMTYGDYCIPPNLSTLVDTKFAIQELIGNCTQGHQRFARELDGAYEMGATLYILIQDEKVKCIDDLEHWENPRIKNWAIQKNRALKKGLPYQKQPPTSGKQLAKILRTMEISHHTKFMFCRKEEMAKKIIELLTTDRKEFE